MERKIDVKNIPTYNYPQNKHYKFWLEKAVSQDCIC